MTRYTDARTVVGEAFRTIRTSLNYTADRKTMKTLLVTSGGPDDGKTLVAVNIALSYAQAGERVLLIDCDLRRPSCHRRLKVTNETGLTNVLVDSLGLSDAIVECPDTGLHILTSGPIPPNPAELLDSPAMGQVLETVRGQYDHVVIDTPPTLIVADATILASKVDGIVLVIVSGETRIDMAQETKSVLEKARGRILGVVLNKVNYGKGHYKYRYYRYGEPGEAG